MRADAPRRGFEGFGRVLFNGLSGAGTRIAMMLVGFLLTPYILVSLGFVDFGLLAIFGALAGYLGLLDFGLGGTFVKFITEYSEKGDLARARQVVTFGMLFYLGFGIALAVPVFFLAPLIVHAFKMPAAAQPHAVLIFREFFSLVIASLVLSVPGTTVVAKHRMDLASRNNLTGYLVYAAFAGILLHLRFGITGIVIAQAAQIAVTTTLQYLTARRVFGPIFADPRRFDPGVVRRMFHFGGWTQVTVLLNVVIVDAGRFLAASLVSVASVTFYEVGGKLAYISRTLPNYLVDAVSPAAAAADARSDRQDLQRLELTGSLYLVLATTLLAGFVVGACGPIMHVWLGKEYPYVGAITLWLAIGYVASSSGTVGVTMLRSVGRPDLEAACTGVGAAVNVAATLLLVRPFGIVGAAMGTCAGWIAFALFYAVLEKRRSSRGIARAALWPLVRIVGVGVLSTAGLAFFVRCPWVRPAFDGRVSGLAGLAVCGLLYVMVFVVIAWALGAFRFDEERITRNALRLRRASATRFGRAGVSL
jgi:O-antigen/teichoic acid export membrane protein